jgi:hypothetical protein
MSSRALPLVSSAVLLVLAVGLQIYFNHVAIGKDLSREDFPAVNVTYGQIPTTYYSPGKIEEVLKDWHHAFHLYRVKSTETFSIDYTQIESEVRAKRLMDNCKYESVLCLPCTAPKETHNVNISKIMSDQGYYASFSSIGAAKQLWDLIGFPFSIDVAEIEHAFVSNLKEDRITAQFHANVMTSSMAIQFIGRKTWIFYKPETFLGQMGALPAAPILLPRRSPANGHEMFVYDSEPGDILFFPESHAHTVYTYAGPNIMVNYRNFHIGNVMRQPILWLTAVYHMMFHGAMMENAAIGQVGSHTAKGTRKETVPEKQLNYEWFQKLDAMCDEGMTPYDQQVVAILKENAKKYK